MIHPWLFKPKLYNDELFSSWLIRTALLQGCDPITLTNSIWPKWRIWTIDRDRSIPNDKLNTLIQLTAEDSSFFEKAFLKPIAERITNEQLDNRANWPFILAYGMRNRRSHAGLQFCPICLNTEEPYFRRTWRIAWNVTCPIHHVSLMDKCQPCLKPIQIQHIQSGQNSLATCSSCNKELYKFPTHNQKSHTNAYKMQELCIEALSIQPAYYRNSFFKKLQFCISLIRFSNRTPSKGLKKFNKDFNIDNFSKGIYFINVNIDNQLTVKKIIIN